MIIAQRCPHRSEAALVDEDILNSNQDSSMSTHPYYCFINRLKLFTMISLLMTHIDTDRMEHTMSL